jgi:mono/diheme cytochrome c family protein
MKTMVSLVVSSLLMTGLVVGVLVVAGILESPLETLGTLGLPVAAPAPLATPTPVPLPPAPRKGEVVRVPTPVAAGRSAPELPAGSPLEPARELFSQNCARCHGDAGDRIQNVNLASIDFLNRRGEHNLRRTLEQGKGIMPAQSIDFEGHLSPEDLSGLHVYVLFLAGAEPTSKVVTAALEPGASVPTLPAFLSGKPQGPLPPNEISHSIWGWEDRCLACHGRDGISPVQVSHAGRQNRTCRYCHWVNPELPQALRLSTRPAGSSEAPEVPHAIAAGGPACERCHSERGYRALSAEHGAYESMMMCNDCHYPAAALPSPASIRAGAR